MEAQQLRESSGVSVARSLFDAAEAKELFRQGFLFPCAVSAYYSLFHLGAALILAFCSKNPDAMICGKVLGNREQEARKKLRSSITTGYPFPDPAEAIKHDYPPEFLADQTPGIVKALGKRDEIGTLRDMREFASYAPRLLSNDRTTQLRTSCHYTAGEFREFLNQHLARFDECFLEAIGWLKKRSLDDVRDRILRSDFVLHEFDALGTYHGKTVRKGAGDIYCSLCEAEGIDWKVYRPDPDPATWTTSPEEERRRYQTFVDSWTGRA